MVLKLKEKPTLKDFQEYIAQMNSERGFEKQSVAEVFMKFLEEVGEMTKAAKHSAKSGMIRDNASERGELPHEIADVFMYLLDIANRFDVDLEKAFREKEEINSKRTWKK